MISAVVQSTTKPRQLMLSLAVLNDAACRLLNRKNIMYFAMKGKVAVICVLSERRRLLRAVVCLMVNVIPEHSEPILQKSVQLSALNFPTSSVGADGFPRYRSNPCFDKGERSPLFRRQKEWYRRELLISLCL